MFEGALNIINGEPVAGEVSQPGGLLIAAGSYLTGDHFGVKAGAEGKGPLWKFRKAA
jgi:hypothetical protein